MSDALCKTLDQAFKSFSKNTALIQHQANGDSTQLSFEALEALAGKVFALINHGLSAEACIGLYMQRSVDHVACIVASAYSNSPYTTINNLVSARQVTQIAQGSNLQLLVCDNSTLLKLRVLTQQVADQKILSNIRILHLHQHDVLPPVYQQTLDLLSTYTQVESVNLARAEASDLLMPEHDQASTNKAKLILFTSGSTGNPKGVMIQGEDLVKRITSESTAYGLKEADVLMNMLPFSFDVGCNQLYSALTQGCTLVLLNSWMPKDILSAIAQYEVVGVSGVPSLWLSVINSDQKALKTISHQLRYITISGGDMADKDRLKLRELLPNVEIFKTYGQTETFRSTMLMAKDFDAKHQSVGQAVDGVVLTILDEDGNALGPNQKGQIVHQGMGVMLGYIGDAEATSMKLRKLPNAETVIYTGDMGSIDEDGFLYLYGRQDRMIKVRGNRVYPEEIERELCTHDDLIEAVSSYNDAEELITAFVRKKQGSAITEKGIMKFLASRLPSYMMPNQCILYDDFPRTASGKVDVPTLTAQSNKIR